MRLGVRVRLGVWLDVRDRLDEELGVRVRVGVREIVPEGLTLCEALPD